MIDPDRPDSGEAILLRGVGGGYLLGGPSGLIGIATPRGIFRNEGISPTPGDHVRYGPTGDPDIPYVIEAIRPRRNLLPRPAVANLDFLFILVSTVKPNPYLLLVDKMLVLCAFHDIEPVVCVTKSDLSPSKAERIRSRYEAAGFNAYAIGIEDEEALEALRGRIRSHVIGFSGPSGVGKSTLLNRLAGDRLMETGEISRKNKVGKHTTRHVELFPFEGGYLADTPGFTSLDLWDAGVTGPDVANGYPEILRHEEACRFQGCRHLSEEGCAVATADDIHPERLAQYRAFRTALDSIDPYSKRRPTDSGV